MKQLLGLFKKLSCIVFLSTTLVISIASWVYMQQFNIIYISDKELIEKFQSYKGSEVEFMSLKKIENFVIPKYEIFVKFKNQNLHGKPNIIINKNLTESTFDFYSRDNIHVIDFQTNRSEKRDVYMLNESGLKKLGSFDGKPLYVNIANERIDLIVQEFLSGEDKTKIISYNHIGDRISESEILPYSIARFTYDEKNDRLVYFADRISKLNNEGVIIGEFKNGKWDNFEKSDFDEVNGIEIVSDLIFATGFKNDKVYLAKYDLKLNKISSQEVEFRSIIGGTNDGNLIANGQFLKQIFIVNSSTGNIMSQFQASMNFLKSISIDKRKNQLYAFGADGYKIYDLGSLEISKSYNYIDLGKSFNGIGVNFNVEIK
jgi:hypothetical protein